MKKIESVGLTIMLFGWTLILVAVITFPFVIWKAQDLAPYGMLACGLGFICSRLGGAMAGMK